MLSLEKTEVKLVLLLKYQTVLLYYALFPIELGVKLGFSELHGDSF